MAALFLNTGAARRLGRTENVYRDGGWVRDSVAYQGDVYPAMPIEAVQFAYKLQRVKERAYPPIPAVPGAPGEVEAAGPSGDATAVVADAEPGTSSPPDEIDIELYRVGESSWYELPNGQRVNGRANALQALGVDDGQD